MKKRVGAPVSRWTPEYIEEIRIKIEAYTDENTIPILAEFCYQNRVPRNHIDDYPELADAKKRLLTKKEAQLEKGTLMGKLNAPMAIFSLKQIGWTDRIDATIENADLTKGMTHQQKKARIEEILANRKRTEGT